MSALFSRLLTAGFHGSIVILAVLLLRPLLKKAPRKYVCLLWMLAFLRLLMPFEIQSSLSLQPELPPQAVRWEQPADAVAIPWAMNPASGAGPQEALPEFQAPDTPAELPAASAPTQKAFSWRSALPWVWLLVALGFGIYSLYGYLSLRRRVRDAVEIPGGWEAAGIDTAFILGFVRPRIYIPMGMPPETRRHILAHERTHLEKGDHWFKMVGFLALALHWFNPLVWAAYLLLCKDIEVACDERVVQFMELPERKAYSAALLDCSASRHSFAASPVAFGEVSVKDRILAVLNYRRPSFYLGLAAVIAIAFVSICLVTSPTASSEEAGNTVQGPFTVPETPPSEEHPEWGLVFSAQADTPSSVTLRFGMDPAGESWDGPACTVDEPWQLERWNGESWEEIPTLTHMAARGQSGIFGKGESQFLVEEQLDLTMLYGSLSEGDYRICKPVYRDGAAYTACAPFHIYGSVLTEEQAAALARCENGLVSLLQKDNYTCTLSVTGTDGVLRPTARLLRSWQESQVDCYLGDIQYTSVLMETRELQAANWDKPYHQGQNKQVRFEKDSLISDGEVRFQLYWAEDGILCQETDTYTFLADGSLGSIDRTVCRKTAEGDVYSRRKLTVGTPAWPDAPSYKIQNSFDAAEESPWRIHFRVDDDLLTPTGGEVWFSLTNAVGVSKTTTDGSYWLERKVDGSWERMSPDEKSWGEKTYRVSSRTEPVTVSWEKDYGALDAGVYRMGKRFARGEESTIQYAEFAIFPTGSVQGPGGQEAFARVNAALEALRAGSYHLTQQFMSAWDVRYDYRKWNGLSVTDYYKDGVYSHSSLDTDPEDLFYDQWYHQLPWNYYGGTYVQILFPEGLSVISDREITFYAAYSWPDMGHAYRFRFYFDEAGNIASFAQDMSESALECTWTPYLEWTVLDTSEADNQAWVERIQAQQSK